MFYLSLDISKIINSIIIIYVNKVAFRKIDDLENL